MGKDLKKLKAIFSKALEIQGKEEREQYLNEACEEDKQLKVEVEALLQANKEVGSFMETPIVHPDETIEKSPIFEGPGTKIGRYELLELIGEGGMGLVYLAQQKKPVKRRVALKIIKPGMDSKQIIARFEAERQAFALLDHPNIAHIFDAGTTNEGRPYFVMEYVKGMSITRYCDENKLNIEKRLLLFEQVCEGIHHAHQKGIIHRDIKPSNLLVSMHGDRAVPKIIDFGIAKAVTQPLTDKTFVTFQGQLLGTPEYMSPEQVDLATQDIDTRSDIYSLGVVLYELLAGVLPFERESFANLGFDEVQRTIREQEPASPSTRLTSLGEKGKIIAASRDTQIVALARRLHRELEWIPLKAMRKERCRRYRSATELADDIRHYLNGLPLLAGPETAMYRMQKFVRKHAGSVATVALVAFAVVLGLIVSTAMYFRSEKALGREAIARVQAEDARQNAVKAQQETAGLLAGSYVDRAQALCEQGEVGRGMLWLADSLNIAPDGSSDLDRVIRTSLAAWYGQLHSLRAVVQYSDRIDSVTFTPDGSRILVCCQDGTARFCDCATGKPVGESLRHGSEVKAVAISPDGRRIATRGTNGSVRLWDAVTLKLVAEPIQYESAGLLMFSLDSMRLVTKATDGAIRFWNAGTGKALGKAFQYKGEGKGSVKALACCPGGLRVVLRIGEGIYQMFDADRSIPIGPPVDSGAKATAVAISPDGMRFATAKFHSLIQVWDAATGKLAFEPIVHGGVIYALAFSPDGSRIVSGGNTRMALFWDAATGEPIGAPLRQRDTIHTVAFSPDGARVATGNEDGVVRVWDLIQSKYVGMPVTHEDRILAAAYGQDVLRILTETDDKVQVRDAATGRPIGKSFSHPDWIDRIAFSPDDSRLLTQVKAGYLRLWDVATGELVGELHPRTTCPTFGPDGSRILAGGDRARLWDAATLKCLYEFPKRRRPVSSVAFSPDGSQFLTGSYDGITQLWDAVKLEPIGKPLAHQSEVKAVAFNPNGTQFLIGFADGTVRLWNLEIPTGPIPIGTPLQEVKIVCGVAFSPDGSQLLACSIDRTARLWDTATLKPIGPPLEHLSWWPHASFSPDGSEILLADRYVTAAVWQAPPNPLEGDYERIICWVQVVTGMELDPTGGINVLDALEWQQRRRRLQELGGPPELILPSL
ncbi:MAG: protein kinase domain-containing protein [Planctomycetota bacterium]|jgi:WD40 repeat protein/tRNA A-37 threonylcarbamoyl transferase component Bud32